ncbi:MAG TPA: type II secretion system protein [Patescibacteria group bacterium]|nr:type II secretion system protein [Patescibacteria group bacterium]
MKRFTKPEIISLIVIFLVLIGVSWPNFALSLRRARDQIRRDDVGNIQAAIDSYYADYGIFPASTPDGKLVVCKGINNIMIPCNYGHDTWVNLTPGVDKTYMRVIPGDPDLSRGASYAYFSDGSRYQLLASLEGIDEPGYDAKLTDRKVMCGNRICNIGRSNNVPLYISIEEYDLQIYCGQHPKDTKCLKTK